MNRLSFVFALIMLMLVGVFVFFSYPKQWRRSRWFRITLIVLHSLGTACMGATFVFFKFIPEEWIKYPVTTIGTFYYVVIIMLGIFFAFRLAACLIAMLIKGRRRAAGVLQDANAPENNPSEGGRRRAAGVLQDANTSENNTSGINRHIKEWGYRDTAAHIIISVIFIVLAFALAATGFINIGRIYTTKYDVHIDKQCSLDELNIVLLADIHAGAGTWRESYADIVQAVNEANPDVILIAGDVFDETTSDADVQYVSELISSFSPEYGTYFVYGNHDDDTEDVSANMLRDMGVTVLEDEMIMLGDDIRLVGRMDPANGAMPVNELMTYIAEEAPVSNIEVPVPSDIENAPASETATDSEADTPLIVLTHRPKDFALLADAGCDLVLAGHTHGFNIPQFLMVGLSSEMLYGIKSYGDMTAIVTSGASAWGFHYKWPAISEIVEIHLIFGA